MSYNYGVIVNRKGVRERGKAMDDREERVRGEKNLRKMRVERKVLKKMSFGMVIG